MLYPQRQGREMQKWAKVVKKMKEKVLRGMVPANNHYAGFGPATANGFKKMLGQPPDIWEEMKQARLD